MRVRMGLALLMILPGCALISGLSDVKTCATDPCPSIDVDGGSSEAGIDVSIDSASCPCTGVPEGWQPIGLVTDDGSKCALGLSPVIYTTIPTLDGDSCPCNCAVTGNPTCPMAGSKGGSIGDMCKNNTTWTLGSCVSTNTIGVPNSAQCETISPVGGACSVDATPKGAPSSKVTACAPPPSCLGLACAMGDATCIVASGNQMCPSTFPMARHVGGTVDASCTCPNKTCTYSASCGGKVRLYGDHQCVSQVAAFDADSNCHSLSSIAMQYGSYKVETTLSASCSTISDQKGMPAIDVKDEKTICCKK